MKKTILKYSSLLALLGAPFFSSQAVAAECATGTSPAEGCTIGVVNSTYTLTGDITPDLGVDGIEFNSFGVDLNLTGDITVNLAYGLEYLKRKAVTYYLILSKLHISFNILCPSEPGVKYLISFNVEP